MRRVIWQKSADDDLHRLQDFLIKVYPPAATPAVFRVRRAAEILADFPRIGPQIPGRPQWRNLVADFGQGAYVLRYRIDKNDNPVILRVHHSRENR